LSEQQARRLEVFVLFSFSSLYLSFSLSVPHPDRKTVKQAIPRHPDLFWEVLGSSLGLESSYPDRFSWFLSLRSCETGIVF
jgi:hypothetical protein